MKENNQQFSLFGSLTELLPIWKEAVLSSSFRMHGIFTLLAFALVLSFVPDFFYTIQQRQGMTLNDVVLDLLPAYDVSLFVFVPLYTVLLGTVIQLSFHPLLSLKALQAYLLLLVMRGCCIYLFPLEPHAAIIPLSDPFIDRFFYHEVVVTKDLFFSGHVATMYLMCLLLPYPKYRRMAITLTVAVAFLLLIQHAHYTLDVLAAPFAAWLALQAVKCFSLKQY